MEIQALGLLFVISVIAVSDAQDYGGRNDVVRGGGSQSETGSDYGVSYDDGGDEGGSLPTTLCYTCHFERKLTDYQGTLDCDDPFRRSGIPQVACQGSCGKLYYSLENDYVISRVCMPKCMPGVDERSGRHTYCCYSRLCNGSRSLLYDVTLMPLTMTLTLLVSLWLTLVRYRL